MTTAAADVRGSRLAEAPAAVASRRRLYLPSLLLALVTGWFVWEGASTLDRHGQLGRALSSGRAELVGPIVVAVVLSAIACERLWPAERRGLAARGHVQDACYFVLFAAAVVPLVILLGVASAHLLLAHASWLETRWTAQWPRPLVVGVALVVMDGCNWLTHLADHRFAPLWRVHAVHHSQEDLSVLTTFRTHPLVHAPSFFAATVPVVVLLGPHPLAPALVTAYLCLGALPHANVRWTFGPVGKVIVSPAYHRIHHAIDRPYDVNLGIVLTVWDVLARRAVFPTSGAPACRTGLAGRPVPVEQEDGRSAIRLVVGQLVEPFAAAAPSTPARASEVGG